MNQDNILVTSSDNIPFSEIEQQFGVVDSQIVVGANIFRDTFAGIRDIFGGETKGYKKDINKMKAAALSNVKDQAIQKGANAIIALKIDLDELSGGNKSMFMMNIYGSAVKLSETALESSADSEEMPEVVQDDIDYFKKKSNLRVKIDQADYILNNIQLSSISKFSLWNKDTVQRVLDEYYKAGYETRNNFQKHLDNIPVELVEYYLANNFDQIPKQTGSIMNI